MEVNPADATVQQAHKMEEASDVGSSANESAQAVAAGTEPTTSETEALTASTAAEPKQARTPTSDSAPSVDNLEDGLVRLGITPSPSPPPAHHLHAATPSTGFPRSDYVPPLPGTGMDATNVFIKYLPTDLTNTGLYTLFSQFGEITSCKVMVDPITGYSLGYGFVRFSSAEEAANAINNMYGQTIGNKTLLCKLSHGIPQNNATPSDNLYIKPLLDMTSEADLLALFSPFGRVLECKVMLDKNTGQSRQIGFVRFATIEEATKALAANNGRYLTDDAPPMVVKYAESRSQKIARRAKLLANQVAAESRRNNALKYQHIPTGEDLEIGAEVTADAVAHDADATQGGPGASSSAAPASMPYIVKDEYGNVTFAPEPEQVESAAQAAPAPTNNYWNGRANGQGHYEGGGRGGRRGGGPRSSHRPRASYQPYHPSETDGAADDTDHAPVHVPHHNHAVYRKKGHAGNNAAAASNGDHSAAGANASAPSHHHQAPHHRSSHPRWTLPTFHNSPTPRVQLAGKVEVGQNGELSAPDWADDPTRLFVSHLPLDYEASELQALFEVHGTVTSAKISQDKRSVRPKTYGFVQLATPEAAAKAVKEMHGTMVDGRPINVAFEATLSVAKQRNESDPYYRMAPNAGPHHLPAGGRGPHRGRGGRGPRGAVPYQPTYYQAPYMGEAGEAPPPYMYMIDPATGMPYPYPVYFPSVPVSYIPEVAHAEPYYPSTGVSAQNAESS